MSDQLDNELRNHIKEVFDRYEVPVEAADAGWTELRKRFPAKRKRRVAAWWLSSAAALLLFILGALWLNIKPQKETATIVKNNVQRGHSALKPMQDSLPAPDLRKSIPQNNTPSTVANNKKPLIAYTIPQVNTVPWFDNVPQPSVTKVPANTTTISDSSSAPAATYANTATLHKSVTNNPVDSTVQSSTRLAKTASPINTNKDSVKAQQQPATTMADLLARDAKTSYKNERAKASNKKLIFSVYAGTYLNYAKGSNSQLNAGAGVNSDIKLMKKLKLVTGIAIAQNSLKYDAQPAQPNVYAAAIAATRGTNNDLSSSRLFSVPGFNATSTTVTTQINGYNASFTGIDIPVNIKYELNPDKNDTYISAGVSSGTFINETYNYNYSNTLLTTASETAKTQTSFGSFDFARTLNVSFGVGTPLGKSNRLIIEPFVKYPLSGLGTQQIKFGASGINLKLKFQSHK